MDINIGIPAEQRQTIADGLSRVLADTYTLYLKTHNYHWNVTGPMFNTLHLMFEGCANRTGAGSGPDCGTHSCPGLPGPEMAAAYSRLSSIKEEEGVPNAQDMIRNLVAGQEAVACTARSLFPAVEEASDEPTADLIKCPSK
ncbi:MAG: Dps family protein [Thiolinea sp.]